VSVRSEDGAAKPTRRKPTATTGADPILDGSGAPKARANGAGKDGADDRREQMLRAAVDVIGERGFPDTRIADVGRRVGASSALVIYYFGTKDKLLTEALRYSEESFYSEVAQQLSSIDSARGKLEALVRFSFYEPRDSMPGSWVLWIDLWAQALRHPEVSRDREELDERWRSTVKQIVVDGLASGEFRDVDASDFAVMFCALLDGLAVQLALADSWVTADLALELCMSLASRELGFERTGDNGGKPGAAGAGRRQPAGRRNTSGASRV